MVKTTITLRLTPERKEKLSKIAEKLGYFYGGNPSINALLNAIADEQKLVVVKAEFLGPIVNRQVLKREILKLESHAQRIRDLLLIEE